MSRVVLILADLYPPTGVAPEVQGVPRLPTLEYWLARAQRAALAAAGWREWLAAQPGLSRVADRPSGDVAGGGSAGDPACWLATPVHYVAGLDTVRLHAEGLVQLPLAEQQRLSADFARVFAGSGFDLQPTGARELLLRGPPALADAPDPARFLGTTTAAGQLHGAGAAPLRRLQAEIEMWLHGHAVAPGQSQSQSQSQRGVGQRHAVNGLWLWGQPYSASLQGWLRAQAAGAWAAGSHSTGEGPADGSSTTVLTSDLATHALAHTAGAHHESLPARWSQPAGQHSDRPDNLYVVLPVAGSGATSQLAQLERDWLLPVLAGWRSGHHATLQLVCGDHCWTLSPAARWRFWRRPAHWLPELLAC